MADSNNTQDLSLMGRALELAERGLLTTTPNPRVGCVVVKDGKIIGEGHTQPAGQAHAEVQAIRQARESGHDVRGATAYITLEPCSHHGRTPPCTDLLLTSGIARVVAASEDPNPLVSGKGFSILRSAGVEVVSGVCSEQARELNIGFFSRMERGRPWVRMKVAASLDGTTALHNGRSQWITGQQARDDGHYWRARACAVLTGIGTVKADDPMLNVRAIDTPRQPWRTVIDSRLEIDPQARILSGGGALVFAAQTVPEKETLLRKEGTEVLVLPGQGGKVDLRQVMTELGNRGVNELHVEAGTKLNGSLVRSGCVDELLIYLAPAILGSGCGMFNLPMLEDLNRRYRLKFKDVQQMGEDLRILARFID
jgi:diaminohydroxyphosphoribosylaminopyrimidine deaminase/5-amino-6-(5-phosphoribosylamino)uracil reductase